jgi:threonine dehydratase
MMTLAEQSKSSTQNLLTCLDSPLVRCLNELMDTALSVTQIREAQKLLADHFPVTRILAAPPLAQPGTEVHLKLEIELPTGSFKPRGALYALALNLRKRAIAEVVASSTGNHGAAVAWAARTLNIPATIFLPANPNPVKRKRIADLGARIVEAGGADLAQAFQLASEYSARPGVYFLNDATDADLPAGPATIGLEILKQLSDVVAIFVPMGDTALIRGVGAAVKHLSPKTKIIGVQAELAPSYFLSWKAGMAVPTDSCDSCADGLATRTPEAENVAAIREVVDDVVLVSEQEMLDAIHSLYFSMGITAEPAGAAATAAYRKYPGVAGCNVALVTGTNISDGIRQRAGLPSAS